MDTHGERSRLLNKHKKDRSDLEKDVKKKKGAMKEAAQKQLEELEKLQQTELEEFDREHGLAKESATEVPLEKARKRRHPTDIVWSDLSKKELMDECTTRGLSKGGNKEELVTRLLCWASEQQINGEENNDLFSSDELSDLSENSDSSSENELTEEQRIECEKQYKREVIVRKAILHLFETKFPDGFALEDLPQYLEKIKVMNFKPESLGYASLHDFARKQPRDYIVYDKHAKWIKPVPSD